MKTTRILMRLLAALMALAMLGGGVAFAESDVAEEGGEKPAAEETVDDSASKPGVPDELREAVSAFRSALKEWRHCIIDMVKGDTEVGECGPAPLADDYGLSEEDLLELDLNERVAARVDRMLTRVEIKTTCIEEHATEGRRAVYECVFTALQEQFGDDVRPLRTVKRCRGVDAERTAITTTGPDTGAEDRTCEDNDGVRERRTDRQERRGEKNGTGGGADS